jgi:AcrR family transcriptional regulator
MSASPGGIPAVQDDARESPPPSRPRLAERRKRQRREARRTILDATEALMIEANGSDFSIRALGRRSGYSAPTVYHYFGDKDGLIDALLEDRIARLADQLEQVEPTGDAQSDLRALLLGYLDFSARHPTFTRLMWTLSRKGESRMPAAMDRVRSVIESATERFGASGRLGQFDPDSAGRILWGLAYGLVSLRITQPDFPMDDQLAGRALDALFLGMAELEIPS